MISPLVAGGVVLGTAYLLRRSGGESEPASIAERYREAEAAGQIAPEKDVEPVVGVTAGLEGGGTAVATSSGEVITKTPGGHYVSEPGFVMEPDGAPPECSDATGKPISCVELQRRIDESIASNPDLVF